MSRALVVLVAPIALVGLVGLFAAPSASAQTPDAIDALAGRPVATVRFEVEGRPDESAATRTLVDVRVGAPLRLDEVRSSVQHLAIAGRFDDVEVLGSDSAAGVDLVFKLTPHHPIDRLDFQDDTGLPPDDLNRLVRQQIGGLGPDLRPRTVEAAVLTILQDEGYLGATVSSLDESLTHAPDRATLVVHLQAGPRARVGRVTIAGTSPIAAAEILSLTGTAEGAPYRPRQLSLNLSKVRDTLKGQRFYEAQAYDDPHVSADRTTVDLTLTVDAGPRVRIAFDGDARPDGDVDDFVPIERESSADDDLLEDSDQRLATALTRDGFRDATVTHTKTLAGGDLVITFHIVRGTRYVIARYDVTGNTTLAPEVVQNLVGLRSGQPYSVGRVNVGVGNLVNAYRTLGFYQVSVTPTYEETLGTSTADRPIAVEITIVPGPKAHVAEIVVQPATTRVPAADVRAAMVSRRDAPYVARQVSVDEARVEALYADRGFLSATVHIQPQPSPDRTAVTLAVTIVEGPQVIVDTIRVAGNDRVSSQEILDEMTLKPGRPYGASARVDSQQRILAMTGFRNVTISTEPLATGDTRAHVVVTVEEGPATTVAYGGGIEVGQQAIVTESGAPAQQLYFAPRGFFEVDRENVGGRNRSLDFFSRISLRPKNQTFDPTVETRGYGFSEYRVSLTYRERRAFHTDTDILFSAVSEQVVQTLFNYLRQSANADLTRRMSPHLTLSGRYSLDFTRLFDVQVAPTELLTIDRLLPNLRLSSVSGGVLWDRRNDPIAPWHGSLVSADTQVALRSLGSQVGFVKTFLSGSVFRSVTDTRRFVLAGRAEVGLAHGFLSETLFDPVSGEPVVDPVTGQPEVVASVPASERFYGGGSTTVRGFDQDLLGVAAIIDSNGLSLGGNGIVILNGELRTRVAKLLHRDFGLVGFLDGGNVFARAADVNLGQLRGASGLGLRYDSPLGPVRFDYGFKLSRQVINGSLEPRGAWYISLGEAF